MKRKLAILGSTGSIGTQALDVVREHPDRFEIYAITANNKLDLLIQQAREFNPEVVIIANDDKYTALKEALSDLPIKVWSGAESIEQVVQSEPIDMVLTAMVGYAGLAPTIAAIKAKKPIALANKETLVVAGELITGLALEYKVPLLPVDSEHSAIFQCLNGEISPIEKILLTASGGPFRKLSKDELCNVTKDQALKHPNWEMGAKITIDSATMMNKGFEMIEAKWLFDLSPAQVQVVVHPQSIIHSMVQFEDSSVIAQMGLPDMKLPIQYAFAYPHRLKSSFERLDLFKLGTMTFEEPDMERFRNLAFAFDAINKGGNMPCILNAANEIVVEAFLKEKIGFVEMSDIIEQTMAKSTFILQPSYDDYVQSNTEARNIASRFIY
jgi:1-deoxy-D-xylulose-5-phosphate reductoisomerase